MRFSRSVTPGAAATILVLLASSLPSAALPPVTSGLEAQFLADDITATPEGTVDTWLESSAGVLSANQTTATRRPELLPGAVNGHAAVAFDGVDDGLRLSSNIFSSTSFPKTVFAVVRTADVNGHIVGTGSNSTGFLPSYGSALAVSWNNYFYKANSASVGLMLISPETTLAGDWQILVATISAGASRVETRCSIADSSDPLNAHAYSVTAIGSTGGGVDPLDGEIAEILVYDRVLNASEVDAVRSDLSQIYAISVPARLDSDGDGLVDACDGGLTYLKAPEISVTLLAPPALTGGTVENAIDAADVVASDVHNGGTHVWSSGADVELSIDLGDDYDLELLHFWNYTGESFDVDDVSVSFLDASALEVASFDFSPELGQSPIFGQDFALAGASAVRTVEVLLSGTNGEVDFQNIGFSGRLAGAAPVPALGVPARWLLVAAMASLALLRGMRLARRSPGARA